MQEFTLLFDLLSKFGFPIIFIIGQMMEWWYMKPHVRLLIGRIEESTQQVKLAQLNEAKATALAQESHAIAREALEIGKANERAIRELTAVIKKG